MTTRLLVMALGVVMSVHSADAQSVFLKNGENGSHFECAVVSNGYGTGAGVGLGLTNGPIDIGFEIASFGGVIGSSISTGQVGSLDLKRLFNVKGPVTVLLREALSAHSGGELLFSYGPAMYLVGISPEGAVVGAGVGLMAAQPLRGSGRDMLGSDAGLAVGYRGRATTVVLDFSVVFVEANTSYSVGFSVNFMEGKSKKFRSGDRW